MQRGNLGAGRVGASMRVRDAGIAVAWMLMLAATPAGAAEIVRTPLPDGSTFPIAAAVEVPAGRSLVFLSGMVPPVADRDAPPNTVDAYGDTKTQATAVLAAIDTQLQALGLTLGDVVKMQVFLVGDPRRDGRMDTNGFMDAWKRYFGTDEQPNLPARSLVQVAALANPGYLVEVEVTAVRP